MTAAASASAAILVGLSAGCAALLALCAVARFLPTRMIAIVLLAFGVAAAVAHLALGAVPARIVAPFHLAGVRPVLVLDGLAGFFLVALLPVGAAGLAMGGAAAGATAVLMAGVVQALLAGETATLVLGIAVAVLAAAGLPRQPAITVLTGLGAYVLVRVLFDFAAGALGPTPPWWGVPLLLGGAMAAVRGAARAAGADDLRGVLAGMTTAQAGLVALGLGMALAARAVDDGPAAMLALGGALFGVLAFGWAQALWAVLAGAVADGAGTQQLDRLGGLAHRMRITTIGALVAGLALAMLPPGAGFAAMWLLLRAALTLPRGGGADWWAIGLVAALALGLSGALLGFAMLRVLGVAFLGRPRTPRTAAAEEVAPRGRWTILALSGAVLACGVLPGMVLALAATALRMLAGPVAQGMAPLAFDGYAPLLLTALLAGAIAAVALAVRGRSPAGHRTAPAWEGGRGPGPAWLPFGDPATQLGATGFAQHLGRCLEVLTAMPPLPHARLQKAAAVSATWLLAISKHGGPALLGLTLLSMLLLHLVRTW